MSWDHQGLTEPSREWNSGGAANDFDQPAPGGFGEDIFGCGDSGGGRGSSGACYNCGQEGHLKSSCPEPAKSRPCYNCGQEGHNKNDCTEPMKPRPCYNCGQEGHNKADCTEPAKPRPCLNCGEEGHTRAECTNPTVEREFTGTCRVCEQTGHRAIDCPTHPPRTCNNCKEEGHSAIECKNARKLEYIGVEDVAAEDAWESLTKAGEDRDLDDIMESLMQYIKAVPYTTYVGLETAFRNQGLNIFFIATEKELSDIYTIMDFQGNLDRKYVASVRLSNKPLRPKEAEGWPKTPEENLERLANAGVPVDRGIPKCSNCDKLGHIMKSCPEEKIEIERVEVKCFNCDEIGHRVRDCPIPRVDKFACRNCKQSGHSSKECPEPRSAEGVECKNCNETGHFAKDCPQGGGGGGGGGACHNCGEEGHRKNDCPNPKKMICRNCDEEGHLSKECPKPRDYSRVKCSNCQEMGHTKIRCTKPAVEEDCGAGGYDDFGSGDATNGRFGGATSGGATSGGANDFSVKPAASGGEDWNSSGAAVVASGSDNWESKPVNALGW